MTLNVYANVDGNVTFYIYGTSEKNFDYLTVTKSDADVFSSKGTDYGSWTQLSFSVSAGSTKFVFKYHKDGSVNTGIDRYCVDYLSAPGGLIPYSTQSTSPSNKTCNSDCTLGSGACYNGWCGDGVKNGPEACDSGSSNSSNYGYHCNSNCTGYAPYCGDGTVNGSEQCDGGSTDCSNVGDYNQGTATCTGSCTWNTTNCSKSSGGGGC